LSFETVFELGFRAEKQHAFAKERKIKLVSRTLLNKVTFLKVKSGTYETWEFNGFALITYSSKKERFYLKIPAS